MGIYRALKGKAGGVLPRLAAGREGFSLVELLIALSVFAVGILGVIGMQLYAIGGNSFAWNMSLAENIAQQKIEHLKNYSYTAMKGRNFGNEFWNIGGFPAAVTADMVPLADRVPPGGDNNLADGTDNGNEYYVDVEDYGQLGADFGIPYRDDDADGVVDPPYDRFRRVTIQKVIDGSPADGIPDCNIIVKVLVYWRDSNGIEHRVAMMTARGFGG